MATRSLLLLDGDLWLREEDDDEVSTMTRLGPLCEERDYDIPEELWDELRRLIEEEGEDPCPST